MNHQISLFPLQNLETDFTADDWQTPDDIAKAMAVLIKTSDRTAKSWVNAYKGDRLIYSAWNKMPLCRGAKKITDIRLTKRPYQEKLADMPQSDLDTEGGLWVSLEEFIKLFGSPNKVVWVVRFELAIAPGLRNLSRLPVKSVLQISNT